MKALAVLVLVVVTAHGQQPKNPFELPKHVPPPPSFKVDKLPLGRLASNFMLKHGKLSHLCGNLAGKIDIGTDFTGPRPVPGSPLLTQSLKWRKK